MFADRIASRLRKRDHDVVAVVDRPELISKADRELFSWAVDDHRAIVTNNVPDYTQLFREVAATGEDHFGLLLNDDRSMPRSRKTIGLFVRVIDSFLREHPGDDELLNQLRWLR